MLQEPTAKRQPGQGNPWHFATWPIRSQLLLVYGGLIFCSFAIVLVICLASIATLASAVLADCEAALRDQIVDNSGFVLQEAGEVFEAKMDTGLRTLALPAAYAVHDASRSVYSVELPDTGYADSNKDTLKPPLTTDPRYPCLASEAADLKQMRGCQNGLKSISEDAASVFIMGMKIDASNSAQVMQAEADFVRLSTAMDDFVKKTWSLTEMWTGSYVALGQPELFRQYPGWVGNLSADLDGYRTYDFTKRPWYTEVRDANYDHETVMTAAALGRFAVEYSEPYWSWDGNGFLLSMNVPIHDAQGGFAGVAGTDVNVLALTDIVGQIRLRQSGSVHLYHVGSGYLAASLQWTPDPVNEHQPMSITSVRLGGADSPTMPASSSCDGQQEESGFMTIRKLALHGKYCLVAVVSVQEVIDPIEKQRANIESTEDELIVLSLVVLLAAFAGLVMPCTLLLAYQVSSPLITTSRESSTIVRNIGGNLFEGLNIDRRQAGVGEVRQLRGQFQGMLLRLKAKREYVSIPESNPAYQSGIATSDKGRAAEMMGGICVSKGTPTQLREEMVSSQGEIGLLSTIRVRIFLQLVLPMTAALILVIAVTSSEMISKSNTWIKPVKDMMVEEELQMLDIRCFERAELMKEIFASYSKTVSMLKDYTERLYSDQYSLNAPYATPFSPTSICPAGAECVKPGLGWDSKLRDNSGSQVRQVDYGTTVWYAPPGATAPSSNQAPSSMDLFPAAATVADEHQGRATHLDNVARVAYFSSHATDIYWGFEQFEVYRQYPYADMASLANPKECNDAQRSRVSQYTPLCRPWYTEARAANGDVVFGKVDTDSLTWLPFISVTAACFAQGNEFVGVVGVTANLGELEALLKDTPLYEGGMAYLFDGDGIAVYHPSMPAEMRGTAKVADLASGSDLEFKAKYEVNVVGKWGTEGTWVYAWYNPDTGEDENWFYSFRPVAGTPYQLVLTAVDREIHGAATRLQDKLQVVINTHLGTTIPIFIITALISIWATIWFNRRFVTPVRRLNSLFSRGEMSGYCEDVPDLREPCAKELAIVLGNFKKLVVGLRFGNPQFHQGDKLRELKALCDAKALMEETGNRRGTGVCLSNVGNCIRGLKENKKQQAQQMLAGKLDPSEFLRRAVENARELVADPSVEVTRDTIGQRLLGLALVHLDAKEVSKAEACLREAVQIHSETGAWSNLARLASVVLGKVQAMRSSESLSASFLSAKESGEPLAAIVSEAADAAVRALKAQGKVKDDTTNAAPVVLGAAVVVQPGADRAVPAHQSADLARLCCVLACVHSDKGFVRWAIDNLPNMDGKQLCDMAYCAKRDVDDAELARVDGFMMDVPGWIPGPPPPEGPAPKVIVFVIDRTWVPILEVCISSIRTIFNKYVGSSDHVGVYGLGEGWIFPPTQKGGNDSQLLRQILDAQKCSGECVLYQSMLDAIACLSSYSPFFSRWLVVLTDLVDLEEFSGARELLAGNKVLAPQGKGPFQVGTIDEARCNDTTKLVVDFGPEKVEEVPRSLVQPFAGGGLDAGMDPELKRRLEKAGARTGQVTLSLKWDATDDLDLHVFTPSGEISYKSKKVGGGWLDVDMNPDHKTDEPVENVFWDQCPVGKYSVVVENFSYGGHNSRRGQPIPFSLVLRTKVPVQLAGGNTHKGLLTWSGTCHGDKGRSQTWEFTVPNTSPPDISARPREVCSALQGVSGSLTVAVVDSSRISGWNPSSHKWPAFRSNMSSFMHALAQGGQSGHHLQANDLAGIQEKFDEVAALLQDAGLDEHL